MKVFPYFLLFFNLMIIAAAPKAPVKPANAQPHNLVHIHTKLGAFLNTKLLELPQKPDQPTLEVLNRALDKGKELHAAHLAFNKALNEKIEGERLVINAGRTCFVTSTVNPIKLTTAEYQKTKKENCTAINRQFPQAHPKFEAFPAGAAFKQKEEELSKIWKELQDAASFEVQEIIGQKLGEIDTLSNLINHFGPPESNS